MRPTRSCPWEKLFLSALTASLAAEASMPLARGSFSVELMLCWVWTNPSQEMVYKLRVCGWVHSFLAEPQRQGVLSRGCRVRLPCCEVPGLESDACAARSDAVTCRGFLPSWQRCVPRRSLHPRPFAWSICTNRCEANQLAWEPTWGRSLPQLGSPANQFLTSESPRFGPWAEHGAVWYTCTIFYLALIFHILLYLTRECLQFNFCQSIENFRKKMNFFNGDGGRRGEGRGCSENYKAINC